jgi:hypothetical protein
MRKLILTSFTFKTGENECTQPRLVVLNVKGDEPESDLYDRSIETVKHHFPDLYPESTLISIVCHPTLEEIKEKNKTTSVIPLLQEINGLKTRISYLEKMLKMLDQKGGLGNEWHEWINQTLDGNYPFKLDQK